jgi:TetR/AcrR family tetracycline transcriptional repressor
VTDTRQARATNLATAQPGPERALTREQIAAAALELLDRHGLDALSMRRLSDTLGVGTMTLYGYFRNKDDLLDAVMDLAAAGAGPIELEGPWRERARAIAEAIRAGLERHPSLVQLRLRRPLVRPSQFAFTEAALRALVDAGLDRASAARAFRAIFVYTFGFAAFSPASAEDAQGREIRAALSALPPGEYPLLTSMVDEAMSAVSGDVQFGFGLDLVLDGIEARAAAS